MYVEYSAIGFQLSGESPSADNQDAEKVRENLNNAFTKTNLCWLNPISKECDGSINEWIMLKEKAIEFGINTMSDVIKNAHNFRFGAWPEYFHRASNQESFSRIELIAEKDGKKLEFKELKEIEIMDRYKELFDKKIDVCVGWTRDPEIIDYRITKITYDEPFLSIPQHVIPICRKDVAAKIEPILNKIQISIDEIQDLKLKADKEENHPHSISEIAREFCYEKKWIRKPTISDKLKNIKNNITSSKNVPEIK